MASDIAEEQNDEVEAPPVDVFAGFAALISLLVDSKQCATELDSLKRRLAAVTAAEKALAAERVKFDAFEQAARKRHAEEHDALTKRRGAVYAENAKLDVAAAEMKKLQTAWRNFGESDDVVSGFRSPSRTALEKARHAHGLKPLAEPEIIQAPQRFNLPSSMRRVRRGAERRV